MDNKSCTALVMIDISSAFDTIDHNILLRRLSCLLDVRSSVLFWLHFYLCNRTQSVLINNRMSESVCRLVAHKTLGQECPTFYSSRAKFSCVSLSRAALAVVIKAMFSWELVRKFPSRKQVFSKKRSSLKISF